MEKWTVYIIKTRLGTLYTGATNNIKKRFKEHVSQGSKTAKYLLGKDPLELVYVQEVSSKSEALSLEAKIKKLSKKDKSELLNKKSN